MGSRVDRRRFLGLVGVGTALPLAGCGLLGGGSEDGGASTPESTPSPSLSPSPSGGTATDAGTPDPRRLGWGEAVTTPQGLRLSVRGGSFSETYSGAGSNRTVTPPGDRKFVLVLVEVRNPEQETIRLPSLGYFHVRAKGTTYDVLLDDAAMQLPVEAGTRRRVQLPFLVPSSVTSSDLAVWWTPAYEGGRVAVVWSST